MHIRVLSIVLVLVLMFTLTGCFGANNRHNEYVDMLNEVSLLMLSSGADAETEANMVAQVWGDAVNNRRSNPNTQEFMQGAMVSGRVNFDLALGNYFRSPLSRERVADISRDRGLVQNMIRDMQSYPVGFERVYDALLDLHTAYIALTNLATNPTGSLQTFSSARSAAISDFMVAHERLQTLMPEKR